MRVGVHMLCPKISMEPDSDKTTANEVEPSFLKQIKSLDFDESDELLSTYPHSGMF